MRRCNLVLLLGVSASCAAPVITTAGTNSSSSPIRADEHRFPLCVDVRCAQQELLEQSAAIRKLAEDSLWMGLRSMSADGVVLVTDFDAALAYQELSVLIEEVEDCPGVVAISAFLFSVPAEGTHLERRFPRMFRSLGSCQVENLAKYSERLGKRIVEGGIANELAFDKAKRAFDEAVQKARER